MIWIRKYGVYLVLLILLICVLSINFNKPFGFFRESNAALVCINANVWNNYPAIKATAIPVNSYAFLAYHQPEKQLYNATITFGSWWISFPYYFFSWFNVTANEAGIRIFAIVWFLFTILTVWLLTKSLVNYYGYANNIVFPVLILYVFSPAIMWYNVQGYVHEIAVLPFYFLGWTFLLQYLKEQKLISLVAFGILIFISLQFDWLCAFQAFTAFIYLFLIRKKLKHQFVFILPAIFVFAGIAFALYKYINWAGFDLFVTHLKKKFGGRTVGAGEFKVISFLNHNFNVLIFYVMGLGITVLLAALSYLKRKIINPFLLLMAITALLHHIVFWGFTTEHDHSALKMFYPIIFLAALSFTNLRFQEKLIAFSFVLSVNIGLYFLLHNYPLRKGMYTNENFCYQVGKAICYSSTDKEEIVFANTDGKYYTQIEFYAGKYYVLAKNIDEAKSLLQKLDIGNKGCFVVIENAKVVNTIHFTR